MKKGLFWFVIAILPAGATTIYTNLAEASGSGTLSLGSNQYWASEFDVTSSGLSLSDIIVGLDGNTNSGILTAFLYGNTTGPEPASTPLATIASLNLASSPLNTTTFTNVTFTASSPIALTNGTEYWIVLTGNAVNQARWETESTITGTTGVAGQDHDRGNSGGTYDAIHANSTFPTETPVMEVDVTSGVPEPATLALVGLALAGLGLRAPRVL